MKSYTVVLLKPHDIASPTSLSAYVAHIPEAVSTSEAVEKAQDKVYEADQKDIEGFDDWGFTPNSYSMIAVFEGIHPPLRVA